MKKPNDLVAGIYFRTLMFFGDAISMEEGEGYLQKCLRIIPNDREHLLDIGFINYCLSEVKQDQEGHRDALVYSEEALKCVRRFHGKVGIAVGSDSDSPLEVICLQQMAKIYSSLGSYAEHYKAIECQKEAIELCEAHMPPDDEELAEFYILMSRIYLNAARSVDDMKLYADSLEFKIKAMHLNPKLVQANPDLEESGEWLEVKLKGKNGRLNTHFVVIPNAIYSQFDSDYKASNITDLTKYGYEVKNMKPEAITDYVKRYGQLRLYEGNIS
jgi:tetratricopeptide (TPR) repeat protein